MAGKVLLGQRGDDGGAGVGAAAKASATKASNVSAFYENGSSVRFELFRVLNGSFDNGAIVERGGFGVKEGVAEDGQQLLH
jgi:hypothetical protein